MNIAVGYDPNLFVVPREAHRWLLEKVGTWREAASWGPAEPDKWSTAPSDMAPGDQVLMLVGEHGAGKTWLLRHLAEQEQWAPATAVYLDLAKRLEVAQPSDYAQAAEAEVRARCGAGNAILLLDSVPAHLDEHLRALEDSVLRPHLSHRASLVVMALVHPSHVCWRAPALRAGEQYYLPPFNELQTRDQLQRLVRFVPVREGVEAAELQAASGGLPLLTYLLATHEQTEAFRLLLEYWFSRLPVDERECAWNYLEAVCVLDVLEHAPIQRVLEVYARHRPAAAGFPAHASGVRNMLRKYWLSRPAPDAPGRIVLVESVRRAATQVLQARDAELHTLLCQAARSASEGGK